MTTLYDNIKKAHQGALLSNKNYVYEQLNILKNTKRIDQKYDINLDEQIKANQELELLHINLKILGDLDSSVNGHYILD